MGKKNKQKKSKKEVQKEETKKSSRITMKDLEAMSDDESGEMPPEEEWDDDANALKEAVMGGAFDHLLEREDAGDDESIEEVELNSGTESEDESPPGEEGEDERAQEASEDEDEESDQEEEVSDQEEEIEEDQEVAEQDQESEESFHSDDDKAGGGDDRGKVVNDSIEQKNQVSSKALHIVTGELASEKKNWAWAETFHTVSPNPFACENIHDDLKREVAFYDLALEAVQQGRQNCKEAGIPFSRPEDFFAEMVKSDDHMARVKDRLIFESKKMEAVSQRRTNKEQKLRSKEAQSNKLAEKAKRKKEHFQALQDWADAAKTQRGGSTADVESNKKKGKNRQFADKKFGFGGKRGRFKQNDAKSINDMSGYNPRGNFEGGMKRTLGKSGSGGGRKGKRARDASRTRR